MFPLMDRKEHRLSKECMTVKGGEGRTRIGHWIKGAGEQESCYAFHLVRDCTEYFFLLFGTRRKESGDGW